MSDLPEVRGELYGEAPGATRFQVGAFAGPRIHGQPAAWATLHTLGPFHLELPPGTWYLHAVGGAPDDGGFLSGSAMGSYGGIYGYGAPLPVGGAAPATVRIHLSPLWRDLTHVPHHRQPALSDEQWRAVHTVIDALGADLASRVDGDLGRAAGLVRTRLSALFRRATGLTMEEYRIRLRLEAAKALLVAGDGDLLALALEVGYETQAQLGRMFRRHLGISPGEFRRLSRALAAGAPAPGLNAAGPGAVLRHALRRLMRRGGTLRGTVSYAGSERGVVIYISAFPRPEPDSYPVAWVALPAPGPFTLRGVPAGRWYILAAYCRRRMLYPGDFHTAFAYGGYGAVDRGDGPDDSQPVTVGDGEVVEGVDVTLVDGDHATYAESVRAAAVYLGPEARWTAEDCLAVQRGAGRGTVACRVWLHRPGRAPHPMLTLSAWRRDGELWQMCRIYEEVGVPERPADDAVLAAHADSVQTWDACLRSGDPAPALAVQSPELRAVFGNAQMEAPRQMDAAAYGQACTAVVTNRHGDGWRTLARIGEARSADEGMVLSHDLALDKGRSFDVFSLGVWRRTAGGWRLIRIYEEA